MTDTSASRCAPGIHDAADSARRGQRWIGLGLVLLIGLLGLSSPRAQTDAPASPRGPAVQAGTPGTTFGLTEPSRPAPPLQREGDLIPDWQAWLELARLQSYISDYDASLKAYDKVIELRPDDTQARLERIKVLVWANRPEDAWTALQAIPEKDLDAESKLIMADLYATRKEYARASALYRTHLEAAPNDEAVRLKLAEVLSWEERYEESLKEYRLLLERRPDDQQLRRKYAFVLSWAGKLEDAARELKRTLP
ncbi:tetratricopeptide repeat protein [Thiocapsa rosea]|uniref:Tetratricopeptide repeat protein n=1 Tax=Thiocapsa rosea TaxID=69360 RepID=A0A495VB65_9GAMM|nr:tetratricopeptide repeat protein [Thiocapsa rosea]RKT46589.1 tetratricopeptide repeat protein [Thiocapsa rosea]